MSNNQRTALNYWNTHLKKITSVIEKFNWSTNYTAFVQQLCSTKGLTFIRWVEFAKLNSHNLLSVSGWNEIESNCFILLRVKKLQAIDSQKSHTPVLNHFKWTIPILHSVNHKPYLTNKVFKSQYPRDALMQASSSISVCSFVGITVPTSSQVIARSRKALFMAKFRISVNRSWYLNLHSCALPPL